MEPDYSGWASKANMRCTDGRTIAPEFGKNQHGVKVPLLYQHNHKDAKQLLGHAILTHVDDKGDGEAGVWTDLFFNSNERAKEVLVAIEHGDVDKLSIWAKDLDERVNGRDVIVHDGVIQEVSVVLAGANPGAGLMNVLAHGAGIEPDDDQNIMFVGFEIHDSAKLKELAHADDKPVEKPEDAPKPEDKPADAPKEEKTVAEVIDSIEMDETQQLALNSFIDDLVTEAVTEALAEEPAMQHDDLNNPKGPDMNSFDRKKKDGTPALPQLRHEDITKLLVAAKGNPSEGIRGFNEGNATGSLRQLVRSNTDSQGKELMHADDYGVQNVEILFPDAQNIMQRPTWVDRRQEWVKAFISGTSHSPFARTRTMYADITADEARARGYIKGNQKVEEFFPVFKRVTGPAWIYKFQKLDREDIINIVDFDVVAWMKAEMRGKLDEELARAALFGDGRPAIVGGEPNKDKIPDPQGPAGDGIRSIVNDEDLYATTYNVPLAANVTGVAWNALLDATVEANEYYLGSGNKTAFVSFRTATRLLTIRDEFGHRMYRNLAEVAGDMDVANIVRVPSELFPTDVLAIVLDLRDYNFGTDRGGEVTLFDDFDIRFNQFLYLIETYLSGALILPYSAQIFKRVDPAGTLVADISLPTVSDNVVTVPTQTGVVYKRRDTNATVAGGSTITLNDTNLKTVTVEAIPASGFYFESNSDRKDSKTFRFRAPAE